MIIETKFAPGDKFWTIYEGKMIELTCNFMCLTIHENNRIENTVHIKEKTPYSFFPKEIYCFKDRADLIDYIHG